MCSEILLRFRRGAVLTLSDSTRGRRRGLRELRNARSVPGGWGVADFDMLPDVTMTVVWSR